MQLSKYYQDLTGGWGTEDRGVGIGFLLTTGRLGPPQPPALLLGVSSKTPERAT